jgi:BlaI family transcriptional regulator, penicillinase repressor
MGRPSYLHLSRRERQIMDVLYRDGRASVARVREALPDPPGYSAVRALLRILEEKGVVRHETEGLQYIYLPNVPRDHAKQSALTHLVSTFFGGSAEAVLAALLKKEKLSRSELDRLAQLIDQARKEETR